MSGSRNAFDGRDALSLNFHKESSRNRVKDFNSASSATYSLRGGAPEDAGPEISKQSLPPVTLSAPPLLHANKSSKRDSWMLVQNDGAAERDCSLGGESSSSSGESNDSQSAAEEVPVSPHAAALASRDALGSSSDSSDESEKSMDGAGQALAGTAAPWREVELGYQAHSADSADDFSVSSLEAEENATRPASAGAMLSTGAGVAPATASAGRKVSRVRAASRKAVTSPRATLLSAQCANFYVNKPSAAVPDESAKVKSEGKVTK
jgi:hypothetical protein